MASELELATNALRRWATTQVSARPRLVADVWRAGERRVAELARLADTTRDTIYADLRQQGIDYTNRGETPVDPRFQPITLYGMTGTEPEPDRDDKSPGAAFEKMEADRSAHDVYSYGAGHIRWLAWRAARHHRILIPLVKEADTARKGMDAAIADSEEVWEALSSADTGRWASAYHRWVQSQKPAREAIARYQAALRDLEAADEFPNGGGEHTTEFYLHHASADMILGRGHDLPPEAANYDQACRDREATATQVLKHFQTT